MPMFTPMVGSPILSEGESLLYSIGTAAGVASVSAAAEIRVTTTAQISAGCDAVFSSSSEPAMVSTAVGELLAQSAVHLLVDGEISGSGEISGVGSVSRSSPYADVSGAGGAGAFLPALIEKRLRKKKEPRKPKVHVMKIGDWPDEVIAAPPAAHDDGEDLRGLLAGIDVSEVDTDEEEAIALILGLAA